MKSKYNFLLIDDSEFDLFVYSSIIKKNHLAESLHMFRSAKEALIYLREEKDSLPPTVVLLDLQMSGMNGFEFMEHFSLLPDPLKKKIRLFMLSSTIDQSDIDRVDADPYILELLSKPLEIPPLLKAIEKHGRDML